MMSTVQRRKTLVSQTALKIPFGESAICPIIRNHQLLSWMILIFSLIGYSLTETSLPPNTAAVEGTPVRLNCSKGGGTLTWWFKSYVRGFVLLYNGDQVAPEFKDVLSVDVSVAGNLDLIIIKASKTSAGCYACKTKDALESKCTTQVIVLDAKPDCSKEKTSDGFVDAICSIGFGGLWPPTLEWRNAEGILEETDAETYYNSKVISFFTVKYQPSAPYNLTCTPKFKLKDIQDDSIQGTTAQNIPEFPNSCTIQIDPSDVVVNEPSDLKDKDKDSGNPPTSDVTVSIHDWPNLHLSLSLATLVFIGMLHKWLWQ